MLRSRTAGRLQFRSFILPALQAFFTALSTALGVILVVIWRPKRTRYIPFYSDASHNDPERIILAIGENIACFFMPLVALAEFLQQSRLAVSHTYPALGSWVHRFFPSNRIPTTRRIVVANFVFTSATTLFFFVTANVPSKYPYTPPHQFAASALIFMYAMQATLKAILANTFANYDESTVVAFDLQAEDSISLYDASTMVEEQDENPQYTKPEHRKKRLWEGWWDRHHNKLRLLLVISLWGALVTTWVCYMGRVITKRWGGEWEAFRRMLAVIMAAVVHVATASCVTLMAIMAIDMRHQVVLLAAS